MTTATFCKTAADAETLKAGIRSAKNSGRSLHQIGVEAGVPTHRLRDWLAGDIQEADAHLLHRLSDWLADEDSTTAAAPADPTRFVATATAEKIMTALDYAAATPAIVAIYGGAGVGKTTALREYAEAHRGAVYISASQFRKTQTALLLAMGEELGLRGGPQRADVLSRTIAKNWPWVALGDARLLIIDEAQHLETPAYDAFRSFFDDDGVGIAYAGNEEVYSRIGGKKRAQLPQVYSRLGYRLHIPGPESDDVDAILDAHGLAGRELRDYAQRVAMSPCGLRGLDHVIRQASLVAQHAGGEVDARMLRGAANALGILEGL